MHTWLPIHVEIPAEHPVVYANYAWSNCFHNCYQPYEQMNKVLQGHWEPMTICQYRCHNIIHVNARCNTKVLTGQTVKRNRWRDHRCHYGQFSWYWDEEWVTCRWRMICASSWLQSWNDDTPNSLLESTTSDSVQRRRFVHPCQSWAAVYRLMWRAPFILHICRYDSVVSENNSATAAWSSSELL